MTTYSYRQSEVSASEQSSQHFQLLSEYTEKLKHSCAAHERIRVLALVVLFFAVAIFSVPLSIALGYYFGFSGQDTQRLLSILSENSLFAAFGIALIVGYFATFGVLLVARITQSKRTVRESSRLLSRLLSRASQKFDQEVSFSEETKLEMEIRLVEAENVLEYAEKLVSSSNQAIAASFAGILAIASAIAALFSIP